MADAKKTTPAKAATTKDANANVPLAPESDSPENVDPNRADDFAVDPKDVDTTGKTEQQVRDALAGREPADPGPETPELPVDTTAPAVAYVDEPDKPVTMGDVAALNGIGIAPDASTVGLITMDNAAANGVFISEGMRNDLDHQGWAIDPGTGRRIVTADYKDRLAQRENDRS